MPSSPRSLYLHIPFCEKKCFYCAFNSYAGAKATLLDDYVDALILELDEASRLQDHPIDTVYVGGGTPTSLDAPRLSKVLNSVRRLFPLTETVEWTVEVNPGTVSGGKIEALLEAGVNRVSMGVQTFDPRRLETLGRIHTPEDVVETVSLLRKAGIPRINLDLIYGQPEQETEEWIADVEALLAIGCDHASLYALQYEEGTLFTRNLNAGRQEELPDHQIRLMFDEALSRFNNRGLQLYEISNFAKAGHESRHNVNYWLNGPYHGIGAGAYGRVGDERRLNENDPKKYIESMRKHRSAIIEKDRLGPFQNYCEFLVSGLRTREGVLASRILAATNIDFRALHASFIDVLSKRRLAAFDGDRLRLTIDGLWVLDSIVSRLMERPLGVGSPA